MGNGRWNAGAWAAYSRDQVQGRSRHEIFGARGLRAEVDPARIRRRESRDGPDNPQATPIILASDVSGSMGMIAEVILRDGLHTLATEIYARQPVTDPHVMIMAVGDATCDRAPLQVTQFEADIRVAEQARELWLEGGGGGNGGETYAMAHLFAALKCATDAAEVRGRKGYLFTIGDEPVVEVMTRAEVWRTLGLRVARDVTAAEAVTLASRDWEVFHILLTHEGFAAGALPEVVASWRRVLPGRTVRLDDVAALAETVVSLIQVTEGARAGDVAASWGGARAGVVARALGSIPEAAPARARRPGGWMRRFA